MSSKNKKTPAPSLYWAYGSNLSPKIMRYRCPRAKAVGKLTLPHGQLQFRSVADVEITDSAEDKIPGGLWEVSKDEEAALDGFEGYYSASLDRSYDKMYMRLKLKGEERRCFFYKRRKDADNFCPPYAPYFANILEGYRFFKLDETYLDDALERSWDQKTWTPGQRQRWRSHGRPRLMKPRRLINLPAA